VPGLKVCKELGVEEGKSPKIAFEIGDQKTRMDIRATMMVKRKKDMKIHQPVVRAFPVGVDGGGGIGGFPGSFGNSSASFRFSPDSRDCGGGVTTISPSGGLELLLESNRACLKSSADW
jgi:hypothetical protein